MKRALAEVNDIAGSEALKVIGSFIFIILALSTAYLYWRIYFKGKRGLRFQNQRKQKYELGKDEENALIASQKAANPLGNLAANKMAAQVINKIRSDLDLPPVKAPAPSQKAKTEMQKRLAAQLENQVKHLQEGGKPVTLSDKMGSAMMSKLQPQGTEKRKIEVQEEEEVQPAKEERKKQYEQEPGQPGNLESDDDNSNADPAEVHMDLASSPEKEEVHEAEEEEEIPYFEPSEKPGEEIPEIEDEAQFTQIRDLYLQKIDSIDPKLGIQGVQQFIIENFKIEDLKKLKMDKLCSQNCDDDSSKFLRSKKRPVLSQCGCTQPYHVQCLIGIVVCQGYTIEEFACENEGCQAGEKVDWVIKDWKNLFRELTKDKKLIFMWHEEEEDEEL